MQRFIVGLGALLMVGLGFAFATSPSIINHSYTVDGDDVRIFRTDNSNGGYVDINLQDPNTKDRMHFGTAKISDQVFTYVKQWDGDQNVWMFTDDGGDDVYFTIKGTTTATAPNPDATRTVIPAVPKTGPSVNIIGIIIATLVIFGGYIYIKKRADI